MGCWDKRRAPFLFQTSDPSAGYTCMYIRVLPHYHEHLYLGPTSHQFLPSYLSVIPDDSLWAATTFAFHDKRNSEGRTTFWHLLIMASRSRPRQLKEELDEERSLWSQIRDDGKKLDILMVSLTINFSIVATLLHAYL
jgi:hypothetical protein